MIIPEPVSGAGVISVGFLLCCGYFTLGQKIPDGGFDKAGKLSQNALLQSIGQLICQVAGKL